MDGGEGRKEDVERESEEVPRARSAAHISRRARQWRNYFVANAGAVRSTVGEGIIRIRGKMQLTIGVSRAGEDTSNVYAKEEMETAALTRALLHTNIHILHCASCVDTSLTWAIKVVVNSAGFRMRTKGGFVVRLYVCVYWSTARGDKDENQRSSSRGIQSPRRAATATFRLIIVALTKLRHVSFAADRSNSPIVFFIYRDRYRNSDERTGLDYIAPTRSRRELDSFLTRNERNENVNNCSRFCEYEYSILARSENQSRQEKPNAIY